MQTATWKKCILIGMIATGVVVVIGLCVAFAQRGRTDVGQRATCEFVGSITGSLILEERGSELFAEGKLTGLPFGKHAIHVHEFGKTGNSCKDAGGHYNPTHVNHGAPYDSVRHTGDWGNFEVVADPHVLMIRDHVAKLHGRSSILDRAIVIHAGEDDLGRGGNPASKLNGNAGSRLACCVITAV